MSKNYNPSFIDLLTLSCFGKIGPRGYEKMQTISPTKRFSAKALIGVGIKPEVASAFTQFRQEFDAEAELKKLDQLNIRLIPHHDPEYPPLLKEISDPPYLLYAFGDLQSLHRQSLAIVGSRKHTHYGQQIIERLIPDLATNGVTIVSGLAVGIDALAHKATLGSEGTTVAVVGCGLDVIYPAEHRSLAGKIVESGGAIISEYPLSTPPLKQHFPARNRIISGVSQGTLVIECDIQSGAMITAHHALEQNRDVYAVPGPITSVSSSGPNMLLHMGAHVVTSAEDLLEHLGLPRTKKTGSVSTRGLAEALPAVEKVIFAILSHDPVHIDTIAEASKLDTAEVNSALLFLEMKGLIRNIGAAQYVRR